MKLLKNLVLQYMQYKINKIVGDITIEVHTPTNISHYWATTEPALALQQNDGPGRWVILSVPLVLCASVKTLRAVYAHECGHIALGHLNGVRGLLKSNAAEMEADRWAVEQGYGREMCALLKRAHRYLLRRNAVEAARLIEERYNALRNLVY